MPLQGRSRTGQGEDGGLAGATRPVVQRGQDGNRRSRRGVRLLGFTIRRYAGKLLIRPSKAAVKRVKHRLAAEIRALRGSNAPAVLAKINPIARGWANYYRGAASSRVFAALDHHLWRLTYKWACYSHPNKPRSWVTSRYYGRYNPASQDRWVFGDGPCPRFLDTGLDYAADGSVAALLAS